MKALQIERPPNGALTHRLKSQKWNKMALFLSCLVFGAISQALLQSAEGQIKYTVTRLVPISGVSSNPSGLSPQGNVVGNYTWRNGTNHVFLNHAGVMHDIAALAGMGVSGINIYGRIVGICPGNTRPYTYFEGKVWPVTLPQDVQGYPLAVNTASHILCYSYNGKSFIWQKSGVTTLPIMPRIFAPAAMNNSDQVVGVGVNSKNQRHAFLISGGQAIDLGTIEKNPAISESTAYAVNDQGQIAGYSYVTLVESSVFHAYIYSVGRMQDIQTIDPSDGSASSEAHGINNSGQVVGQFFRVSTSSFIPRPFAFVYDGSQMIDLNTLIDPAAGWVLTNASAINDAGQIMARGVFQNEGYQEACLLTPVR